MRRKREIARCLLSHTMLLAGMICANDSSVLCVLEKENEVFLVASGKRQKREGFPPTILQRMIVISEAFALWEIIILSGWLTIQSADSLLKLSNLMKKVTEA